MCATSVDNPKIDRAEQGKAMEGSNLNDQICEKKKNIYIKCSFTTISKNIK